MEAHGGEGVLRFFQYVADRTDIALGMFNSPSSGYVLTPDESRAHRQRDPRGVRDEGRACSSTGGSKAAHALAPGARDLGVRRASSYKAGWLQQGIVGAAQLGTAGYLYETPEKRDPHHVLEPGVGRPSSPKPSSYALETGLDQISEEVGGWFTALPGTTRLLHPLG